MDTINILEANIDNFIGIFDTDFDTDPLLQYFQIAKDANVAVPRKRISNTEGVTVPNTRTDTGFSTWPFLERERVLNEENSYMLPVDDYLGYIAGYNKVMNICFEMYSDKYEELTNMELRHSYFNIQQTKPAEGYHVWHCENTANGTTQRVLATMLYLNDDFEGGETEFLYQTSRIEPKTGRVVIWPAHFTHVHRGNPPLSGEKYIATGWIEQVRL